ncbi:hypothetical protein BBP40_010628 [Aspergillus hancockii]|nr:hypothetical protein BBP40_010628 [Aspergillus hancockii]
MLVLGLEADFSQRLIRLERATFLTDTSNGGSSRLFFVSQQQATSALAVFSERIHIYYPILPSDFSEEYFRILSVPLVPSCQSCLVLLVAAIGCVAHDPTSDNENPYFAAALASLPLIVSECTSSKIQNLFKSGLQSTDPDTLELTHRAYWAILLLERQVTHTALDFAKSDIWNLDGYIPLPNCHRTWQFAPRPTSTSPASLSPASVQPADSTSPDAAQSYFLAEIAMRRMLYRCNSAVTQNSMGQSAYAPGIALELERQLDEWYKYLPDIIRFPRDSKQLYTNRIGSLSNFLRVQYYCCRLSIFWPAVYQAIQDGVAGSQLLNHCGRFFDSYIQLIPSILFAFRDCLIYKWTLFLSIFITTMVAWKAADTPCLRNISLGQLHQCLSSVATEHWETSECSSPSLKILQQILHQRLQEAKGQVTESRMENVVGSG